MWYMSLAREEMVLGFGVFGLLGEGVDSVYFECWNQVFLYHMNLVNKNVFLGDDEEVLCHSASGCNNYML